MPYPDHRHMLAWTTIRRERLLPENAIGTVNAVKGQQVNLRDVVARGSVPSRYVFVEAASLLRLRKNDDLDELIIPDIGEIVDEGQVLAGRNPDRGRRVFSPVNGIFVHSEEGRILIQETPDIVSLEAGLVGQVIETYPTRGVVIEAYGALIQGVWGNGGRVIGALRSEPEDGLDSIFEDTLEQRYSGTVIWTRRALKETSLMVLENQSIGGVIAPGIDAALYDRALAMKTAIVLTEGFGEVRMNGELINLLEGFNDRQVTIDATTPGRWEDTRRPEVFINLPARGDRPPAPLTDQLLRGGQSVRLTRAPYAGSIGEITHLPKAPQMMDNGLRVPCARILLVTGESILVPLANLEVLGR